MNKQNSFEGIIEFVAIAEQQGFASAAKHLGCSTSHVSRQINRLEQRLGVALVARTTRSVGLTHAGEKYYLQCRDLVNGLHLANEEVGSENLKLTGNLRISAAGTFAQKFAAPALMEFAKQHPELNLQLNFDSRLINFVEEGFDFAIRVGQLKDSGLVARRLVNRSFMAAASPDYLNQHGIPTSPEQLKHHDCIVNYDVWTFIEDGLPKKVRVKDRFRSNDASVLVDACLQGLGIAYLPKSNFEPHLNEGAVVPILEPFLNTGISSWIVYQNRKYLPMRAKLAIDYLLKRFDVWSE